MAKRAGQTFDGYFRGILQRKTPRAQDPGYLDQALNVTCRGGAIQGRPGFRPMTGLPCGKTIRGMRWHVREDGTREKLVAAGEDLQRVIFGGDPETLSLSQLPLYNQTRVEQQKVNFLPLSGGTNTTFIFDGVNANLKWDGVALTKMGVPNGPTPAAPTPGAGDITPGTRNYVITLRSSASAHEGDYSIVKRTVTNTTNSSFTFDSPVQTPDPVGSATSIQTAADNNQYDDPQVGSWLLYRTRKDGSAYFLIAEADIGVDITDNIPDDNLDDTHPLEELVNGPPQAPIIAMVEHRNQMVAIMADDRSTLRFSNFDPDYMVPEGWPRNQAQPVAPGDGDTVTALRSLGEWCLITKQNSSYAIVGDDYAHYKIVPLIAGGGREGVGTAFPGAMLQADNAVFLASRDGFYRVDREGQLSTSRLSSAIDDLYSAVNFTLTSAAFFDRKRRIIVWLAHG